jgi:hypothetical protein
MRDKTITLIHQWILDVTVLEESGYDEKEKVRTTKIRTGTRCNLKSASHHFEMVQ